jgi:hypothetical protein
MSYRASIELAKFDINWVLERYAEGFLVEFNHDRDRFVLETNDRDDLVKLSERFDMRLAIVSTYS